MTPEIHGKLMDEFYALHPDLRADDPPPHAKPSPVPVAVTPWPLKLLVMITSAVATVAGLAVPLGAVVVLHATITIQIGGGM